MSDKTFKQAIGELVDASDRYEKLQAKRRKISLDVDNADENRKELLAEHLRLFDFKPGAYVHKEHVVVVDFEKNITVFPAQII